MIDEVVACLEVVATDTQSTAVEHTPEGEVEEAENQGAVLVFAYIDFLLVAGSRFAAVLEESSGDFHVEVLDFYHVFCYHI